MVGSDGVCGMTFILINCTNVRDQILVLADTMSMSKIHSVGIWNPGW